MQLLALLIQELTQACSSADTRPVVYLEADKLRLHGWLGEMGLSLVMLKVKASDGGFVWSLA